MVISRLVLIFALPLDFQRREASFFASDSLRKISGLVTSSTHG